MDSAQQPTAPPQRSPDGKWWWDGQQWTPVPAPAAPPMPPPGSMMSGYGAQPPPGYGYQQAPPTGTDGLAIASFVLSIVWIVGLGSIAAVILGHVSRSRAASQGRPKSGFAVAGLILGYLGVGFLALGIVGLAVDGGGRGDAQHRATVKSDLVTAAMEEEIYFTDNNIYTDLATLEGQGLTPSEGVDLTVVSVTTNGYCLSATQGDTTYYYSSTNGGLQSQPCS